MGEAGHPSGRNRAGFARLRLRWRTTRRPIRPPPGPSSPGAAHARGGVRGGAAWRAGGRPGPAVGRAGPRAHRRHTARHVHAGRHRALDGGGVLTGDPATAEPFACPPAGFALELDGRPYDDPAGLLRALDLPGARRPVRRRAGQQRRQPRPGPRRPAATRRRSAAVPALRHLAGPPPTRSPRRAVRRRRASAAPRAAAPGWACPPPTSWPTPPSTGRSSDWSWCAVPADRWLPPATGCRRCCRCTRGRRDTCWTPHPWLRPTPADRTAARPLMSLRTLAPLDGGRPHLKTAVDVQMTSAVRTVSPAAVHNGPAVTALLRRLTAGLPASPSCAEPAAGAVLVDGEPLPQPRRRVRRRARGSRPARRAAAGRARRALARRRPAAAPPRPSGGVRRRPGRVPRRPGGRAAAAAADRCSTAASRWRRTGRTPWWCCAAAGRSGCSTATSAGSGSARPGCAPPASTPPPCTATWPATTRTCCAPSSPPPRSASSLAELVAVLARRHGAEPGPAVGAASPRPSAAPAPRTPRRCCTSRCRSRRPPRCGWPPTRSTTSGPGSPTRWRSA